MMTAEEIVAVANALTCESNTGALAFARMPAEQCAQLADEAERAGVSAGTAIRGAFRLSQSFPMN